MESWYEKEMFDLIYIVFGFGAFFRLEIWIPKVCAK